MICCFSSPLCFFVFFCLRGLRSGFVKTKNSSCSWADVDLKIALTLEVRLVHIPSIIRPFRGRITRLGGRATDEQGWLGATAQRRPSVRSIIAGARRRHHDRSRDVAGATATYDDRSTLRNLDTTWGTAPARAGRNYCPRERSLLPMVVGRRVLPSQQRARLLLLLARSESRARVLRPP